ncbi:hypothetical protein [Actinoplanes sp. NPDC051411]|uniref:hypothetical protein n=1 Tax=Actinoplanes sp. NPDC051411 TaxID=3155522 RepID=UPI003445CCBA
MTTMSALTKEMFGVKPTRNCRAMYDQMARIAVEPQWVRFYDFGAGRMPHFLAELAKKSS